MKVRRLLALSVLSIAFGCEGHQSPTAPSVRRVSLDPSAILSDGAHGGNPDFFFLPPLVPSPYNNPDFEPGTFNSTLQPSLRVEICELVPEHVAKGKHEEIEESRRERSEDGNSARDGQGNVALPKTTTACVAGPPLKKFAAGTVKLANQPPARNDWWKKIAMPADGFYYVVWDTRKVELSKKKYYRIKVFISASTVPMGYADVDPIPGKKKWEHSLSGEVIQLVDDAQLPIPFRVENGALCAGAISCTSETVSNSNPGGEKVIQVIGNDGVPIAGARFPDGWLPRDGPQDVVVTISSVNTGPDNADHTVGTRCHANLGLQQFRSCFKFTTTPVLPFIGESNDQFELPVTVAVCYVLQDSGDPRAKFAELYASGPEEFPHPLEDASDVGILGATDHNCATNTYGARSSNPLVQLAGAGWDKLTGGLGRVFGVKTAYAVDVGLGGRIRAFSNVGPAVSAHISGFAPLVRKLAYGENRSSTVRVTGTEFHNTDGEPPIDGIGSMPVTFTLSEGGGGLSVNNGVGTETEVTVITNVTPIFQHDLPGFASINWTMPSTRGVHTLTATSPAFDGPITFVDTVRGARLMLSMQTGATYQIVAAPAVETWQSNSEGVQVSSTGLVTATIGGENIDGGNAATLTSTLGEVEAHSALVNSFAFDVYPRQTTLVWKPVEGAASYDVVTEFGNGCSGGGNCATWTNNGVGSTTTIGTTTTFGFVGAQPGRWHITAKDESGNVLYTSPFVYFGYNI